MTVYYELTGGPVILEWCDSEVTDWAQRDYYYIPAGGGTPQHGYSVLVYCTGNSGKYIEEQIGRPAKNAVCA